MSIFPVLTRDTAPEASRAAMAQLEAEVGFLPNLAACMAHSPSLVSAFTSLRNAYTQSTLSPLERELVLLAVAREYANAYGVAVHSTVASMMGAPDSTVASLRRGDACSDARIDAITRLARSAARNEPPSSNDLEIASIVGLRNAEALDVATGVTIGKLVACMYQMAPETPLDEPFRAQAWQSGAKN